MSKFQTGLKEGETIEVGVIRLLENARVSNTGFTIMWLAETLLQKDVAHVRRTVEAQVVKGNVEEAGYIIRGTRKLTQYCLAKPAKQIGQPLTKISVAWRYMKLQSAQQKAFTKTQVQAVSQLSRSSAQTFFGLLSKAGALDYVEKSSGSLPASYMLNTKYAHLSCPKTVKTPEGKLLKWEN